MLLQGALPPFKRQTTHAGMSKRRKQAVTGDPMEEILEFCNGEIIESISNLQLMHMMLVYGPCGGGNGLCMGTIQWNQELQASIYERYMRCIVNTMSPSQACNMQGCFAPNDYTDTFCRLLLDLDSAQKLITASLSSNNSLKIFVKELLQLCNRCYSLRIIECAPVLGPPPAFKGDEDVKVWIDEILIKWICCTYEGYALCALDYAMRLPSPERMGMHALELKNWKDVTAKIANKRRKVIISNIIPNMVSGSLEQSLRTAWEQAVTLEVVSHFVFSM